MDFEIRPFDPNTADRADWARYHALRKERHQETEPQDPVPSDHSVEVRMKHPDSISDYFRFAGVSLDSPHPFVGFLEVDMFKKGTPSWDLNPKDVFFYIQVLRDRRREGIGSHLLAEVARVAGERDRSMLTTFAEEDSGLAFLSAVPLKITQDRRENRLYMERVDWAMVKDWNREGPERSPTSTLRLFTGRMDDSIVEEFARAFTEVFNQQPFGATEFHGIVFTPQSIREHEKRTEDSGGAQWTYLTQEPDGRISGLTEMSYHPDEPTIMRQGMTGVRESFRGRGLGKWLKASMLLKLRDERPGVQVLTTGNASSNAAMLSINERLGFRTHRTSVLAQAPLETVVAYLRARGLTAGAKV